METSTPSTKDRMLQLMTLLKVSYCQNIRLVAIQFVSMHSKISQTNGVDESFPARKKGNP